MKSILLTSTALVAFAGAAAADGHATGFSLSGAAELGYNDSSDVNNAATAEENDGFFWDLDIDATASTALDNGLTATATFGFEAADGDTGQDLIAEDYVLSLSGDNASLTFGDVDPVAEDRFGDVDGGTTEGFFDKDKHLDPTGDDGVGFDAILVGEATFGTFTGAVSFGVNSDDDLAADVEDIDAMQVHIAGTVSILDVELAYQDEVAGADSVFGIAASASLAGADFTVSYVDGVNGEGEDETSTGISVAYPFGPVTVGAYYSINDVAEDNFGIDVDYANGPIAVNFFADVDGGEDGADDVTEFGIEGSYDVGNGLEILAGYITTDEDDAAETTYVAATYDLGGGAEFLFSYADDGDETGFNDEVGDPELNDGLTVQVSFEF